MKKRTIILILAVLTVLAAIAGKIFLGSKTANGPGNPVNIRVAFWGEGEEKKVIIRTVKNWQKKHPEIRVGLEHIPAYYTEKVLGEIAGNKQPDIIFCEVNVFVTFFYKDVLLDLTPFLEKDPGFNIKDFFPAEVARFTRKGRIYCIPRDTAPFACVFYNKDIFRKMKIPFPKDNWDMQEFLSTAGKLTTDKSGRHPGDVGFNKNEVVQYGFSGWSWLDFVYAFGGRLVDNVDNPTQCLLNQKPAVDGMKFLLNLSRVDGVAPTPEAMENFGQNPVQLFASGKLAMFQSGIWESPNLRNVINGRFDWDVAMFPKGRAGVRIFDTGGSGYAILNTTLHPKESWEVVKCLAGDEGQIMLADTGLAQPANMKIAEGLHWSGDKRPPQNKKMLNEAVRFCIYQPFHPAWREIDGQIITPILGQISHEEISVEDGFNKITELVNERFAKRINLTEKK